MCGIAGVVGLDGHPVGSHVLSRMTAALAHRGPDDAGTWSDGGAALGFRRLSFLDLAHGNQPLTDETGRYVMVCNGEIYNYRELREKLQSCGHSFATNTDVEVVVHLYEEHGPRLVEHLEGQFALAVLDTCTRQLLLARDPFGVCPLFYTVVDGTILFASEIKALFVDPRVPRVLDVTALDEVLTFPGVLSPRTMFRDVASVPAGHSVVVGAGPLAPAPYWDLDFPLADERDPIAEDAAVDLLEAALDDAVRRRLHADVDIGYYISGGLDSAVIAVAGRSCRRSPVLVLYRVEDPAHDEAAFQAVSAGNLRAERRVEVVTTADIDRHLRAAVRHSECPLKESYNVASLVLSGLARSHGAIGILTGEGADERLRGLCRPPLRCDAADERPTRRGGH